MGHVCCFSTDSQNLQPGEQRHHHQRPDPGSWPLFPDLQFLLHPPYPRSCSPGRIPARITLGWSWLLGEVTGKECCAHWSFSSWQALLAVCRLPANCPAQLYLPFFKLCHHVDSPMFYDLLQTESAKGSRPAAERCLSLCCSCRYHST